MGVTLLKGGPTWWRQIICQKRRVYMKIHPQKGRIYMKRGPIKEIYLYGCYPTKGRSYLVITRQITCLKRRVYMKIHLQRGPIYMERDLWKRFIYVGVTLLKGGPSWVRQITGLKRRVYMKHTTNTLQRGCTYMQRDLQKRPAKETYTWMDREVWSMCKETYMQRVL